MITFRRADGTVLKVNERADDIALMTPEAQAWMAANAQVISDLNAAARLVLRDMAATVTEGVAA